MKKIILLAMLLFSLASIPAFSQQADWVPIELKFNWDRTLSEVCSRDSQCLVHPLGELTNDDKPEKYFEAASEAQMPKCIADKQYILDYYCDNGKWASRTKLLASQLINFVRSQSAYSIYCDSYDNALNAYGYLTSSGAVESYLGENCDISGNNYDCVNNFCVLKYGDSVAFGVSLNIPINDNTKSFLKSLDLAETSCSNVPNTATAFTKCQTQDGRLWYNPGINSVIYFPTAMAASFDAAILSGAFGPIKVYVENVLDNPLEPEDDFSFIKSTSLFSKIYHSVYGTKSVFGFMEEKQTPLRIDYLGIRYSGVDFRYQNPCFELFEKNYDRVSCQAQGNNVILISKSDPTQQNPLLAVWKDLTAKLRPR